MRIYSIIFFLLGNHLLSGCSENRSHDDVDRVLNDFINYYEHALHSAENHQEENNELAKIEQLSSISADTFRTLAFTWQNQAYTHCVQPPPEPEEEPILSEYDRYVSEEKGSNQLAYIEIGEADQACFKEYYLSHWDQINTMINFHYRSFYPGRPLSQ